MIEVVIDFNEISFDNELLRKYKDVKYNHVPKNSKSALIIFLCKKLNVPGVFGWDAFDDNFADIFDKVPPKDYQYKENDAWCWGSKEIYEGYVRYHSSIGPRNENGEKDDMKLIFINFYPFFEKYGSIANVLLEIILKYINISSEDEIEECLMEHWYKMVLEIRS